MFYDCRGCRHQHAAPVKQAFTVLLVFLLALICTMPAQAQWSGGIEGGTVVRNSGSATSLRLVARNNARPFSQFVFAEWLRGSGGDNSFSVGYNPRYWLSERYYVFGESEIGNDEFIGIDREITVIAGVGAQFIDTEDQSLFAEVGGGGRSIDFTDAEDQSGEALAVARLGFQQKLFDLVRFDLRASGTRSNNDVTETSAEAGLALRIASGAVRVAFRNRRLTVGELDTVSENDTFVTYSYAF